MRSTRFIALFLLPVLLLLASCEKQDDVVSSNQCYSHLFNPQHSHGDLNEVVNTSGANGTNFALIADFDGDCIDTGSNAYVSYTMYSESDLVTGSSGFEITPTSMSVIGNKIFFRIWFRFNGAARVEVSIRMQDNIGNDLLWKIDVPEGAN